MNEKIRVEIIQDGRYADYKKGDMGIIVGFCRGGDNVPYAIVQINKTFQMVNLHHLRALFELK